MGNIKCEMEVLGKNQKDIIQTIIIIKKKTVTKMKNFSDGFVC